MYRASRWPLTTALAQRGLLSEPKFAKCLTFHHQPPHNAYKVDVLIHLELKNSKTENTTTDTFNNTEKTETFHPTSG